MSNFSNIVYNWNNIDIGLLLFIFILKSFIDYIYKYIYDNMCNINIFLDDCH